jgi:flagellar biosynthesis protein
MKKASSLQYDNNTSNAPKVTSYGQGNIAQNIIDVAKKHNIPIKKDEDLIEMLSQIEINEDIPTELYQAVAEVFSFIYNISNDEENKNNES